MGLFLEDLVVGQRFFSASLPLDAAEVKSFAALYDPQPFHLDELAARASLFGGLAASGWQVAALSMRLLVGCVPLAGGLIGAAVEISWPQPTRPGDILQVVCEVVEITPSRSRPERGMVTLRSETRNQRGEVLQILASKMVVPRRSNASA
jgi:acyl dehydratase